MIKLTKLMPKKLNFMTGLPDMAILENWFIKRIVFLGPSECRNLFGPKSKVSSHEKLVLRSDVGFLFLFVLTDSIF